MITTQKELRKVFWESVPGSIRNYYRASYRQNDYPVTVRCAWVDFVDMMHRDGQISEKLANRATL